MKQADAERAILAEWWPPPSHVPFDGSAGALACGVVPQIHKREFVSAVTRR
jgi:hypothetical protein